MSTENNYPWINPIGGLGDMLMLSGILKQVHDKNPNQKYNLVRRTNYLALLKGHPAIQTIGFPPKGAPLKNVDYWAMEDLGGGSQRAYQVLARSFGLETPAEEKLFVCDMEVDDPLLVNSIPWKNPTIVIAPASDSPRKIMPAHIWHELIEMLKLDNAQVLQVGRMFDLHIRNAYSLLGLTTPRQMINVIRKSDVVITSDNFIMHVAHLLNKPAVVLWGATSKNIYGYKEQIHITAPKTCGLATDEECLSVVKTKKEDNKYGVHCEQGERHCLALLNPNEIYSKVKEAMQN